MDLRHAHELCLDQLAEDTMLVLPAELDGQRLLEQVLKPWEVRHEVFHAGKVTDHLVGRYSTRWGAWLAARWHAAWFLGHYDYIFIFNRRQSASSF